MSKNQTFLDKKIKTFLAVIKLESNHYLKSKLFLFDFLFHSPNVLLSLQNEKLFPRFIFMILECLLERPSAEMVLLIAQ